MKSRGVSTGPARALAAALLAAAMVACASPENERRMGGGPGADPGNRNYPLPELHGRRARNNPSAKVPDVGQVPREAKGVPGYWDPRPTPAKPAK